MVETSGTTRYVSNVNYGSNNRHIFKQDKNKVYVDNTLIYTHPLATFSSNASMFLFARNDGNGSKGDAGRTRIYSAAIFENGIMVRNYVPCKRMRDNVFGMYDKITKSFYTNSGSGTFSPGPVISGKIN